MKFYADVHRTKRNGEGYRITYTTDGKNFQARRRLQRDSGRALARRLLKGEKL
ncbi:MAG: hypothetical protein RQ862_04685 [Candidatus Caldarchaeales archaeon]|nr:hypothetical protein [Candidatus Caldarchaeales archaeon]